MEIKIIKEYFDKQLNRWVAPDEKLNVSQERGEQIIAAGYAVEIENQYGGNSEWQKMNETD